MQKTVPVFFVFVSLWVILFAACGKSSSGSAPSACQGVAPSVDSPALLSFAKAHGITSLKDTAGLYYQVVNPGTGERPTYASTLFVKYTATLLDSTIVDSTTNPAKTGFTLGGLIRGWQLGLPAIQAGGRIKLLIPSEYAYGCQGSGPIPPNTPMFFDITLVSLQ